MRGVCLKAPFSPTLPTFGWVWLSLASGFAALVYQILWVKQVTNLFGATAHTVSITLVAFFLGLSVGTYYFGKWSIGFKSPFKALALIELGILLGNILVYLLAPHLEWLSVHLLLKGDDNPVHALLVSLLVLVWLFPTSFLLGGTYPTMVQAFSFHDRTFLNTAIYGLNTIGACLGALLGGTLFPHMFGYLGTGLLALGLTFSVVMGAWLLSFCVSSASLKPTPTLDESKSSQSESSNFWAFCFISGFASLGLEVVWTHMFSQVLQNSVYSFACILSLFLLTQALGAGIISIWGRKRTISLHTLGVLTILISLLVMLTPFVFHATTDGLTPLGLGDGFTFSSYLLETIFHIALVLFLPALAMGCFFPILISWCSKGKHDVGRELGKWVSINTFGAIMGSLVSGFMLIPNLGTWGSLRVLACLYVLLILLPHKRPASVFRPALVYSASALFLFSITLADPTGLPLVQIMKNEGETLLHVEEDEEGLVAVLQKKGHRNILVNNSYTLGGTKSAKMEARQSHLPLVLHPHAKELFYLGMGTGITAGASLKHPVERVVITELVGNSIKASELFFGKWNVGIFHDPRSKIIHGDGRQILKHSREQYDLVIADLFLPWKKGTGSLYTLEHYQSALSRLKSGGALAQWLPLYQMTKSDFDLVARTMLEVFPMVTVWRGDFFSKRPIVCLLGHHDKYPFDPSTLRERPNQYNPPFMRTPLHKDHPKAGALFQHYIGCLDLDLFVKNEIGINTENHPLVELRAPIHHRQVLAGYMSWFNNREFLDWMEDLASRMSKDPFLNGRPELLLYSKVGLAHHRIKILEKVGSPDELKLAKEAFQIPLQDSLQGQSKVKISHP